MFKKLVNKLFGDPNLKILNNLQQHLDTIADLENKVADLDDEALRAQTAVLQQRLNNGETLENILEEAFALVREASRRTTGLRHYDVQMMGGILMHKGEVVEMRTGEGKTLVATTALYLNALTGKGAHLVTVNDYLARRDGGWMGKIFHFLGLTTGCIGPQRFSALYDPDYVNPGAELEDERLVHWRPCSRQEAYRADITYGTSSEFGFDYLRDNMVRKKEDLAQRTLNFAVIDEVDNILIDEARTPLIISGPSPETGKEYGRFATYVRGLKPNTAEEDDAPPNGHYDLDEKSRSISLTDMGIEEIEKRIPEIDVEAGDSLYDPTFFHLTYYLDNALRAQYLFKRDHQYVVKDGEILIVDDFTGRLMAGRRYSEGLHEAIESKEGVQVKRENVTIATITLQNYFRLYDKLAGMTGTAQTDAEEFQEIYELGVTPLPTNVQYLYETGSMGLIEKTRKVENATETYYVSPENQEKALFHKRIDFPDQVYRDLEAKDMALINETRRVYESGRPVLVGTTSVEHSENIHRQLTKAKIPHKVLNAKMLQSEALVVAQAGRKGAVTISTNMAGRGTDILMGGNPEGLSAEMVEEKLFDRNLLTQLLHKWLNDGADAARKLATKQPKLDPKLVDQAIKMKADFDAALEEIEEVQVIGYLARVLQEPYQIDYNKLVETLRLVRANQLNNARQYLSANGFDSALVEDALRQFNLYTRYQNVHKDNRASAQFFTDQIFENHYNARAALIRAVIGGEDAEAEKLTAAIPGLMPQLIKDIKDLVAQTQKERAEIMALGGLHVIGSERHESRRIDNQLRGRSARQGDPGSSRFFLSLEDDLMRRFGGERLKNLMNRLSRFMDMPPDMPIEDSRLDKLIASSQERLEGYNFDIRKNVVEYDDVMNKQRQTIYDERRNILMGSMDSDERVATAFDGAIAELVDNYIGDYPAFIRKEITQTVQDFSTDATDHINLAGIIKRLRRQLPGIDELDLDSLESLTPEKLTDKFAALAFDNLDSGENIYQLLQAMRRFLPLLPPVPNIGIQLSLMRTGRLQAREKMRRDFIGQVQILFNDFLASHIDPTSREAIWQAAEEKIADAYRQFNVEGISISAIRSQQIRFRLTVDNALKDLLLSSLKSLEDKQLIEAILDHVEKQQERWETQIGESEYQEFKRILLLNGIDREWQDYLIAIDDLRREVGLEAFAQKDPKVEYKKRSFLMFADMRNNIDKRIVENFFKQIAQHQDFLRRQAAAAEKIDQASKAGYQMVQRGGGKGVELRREMPKVGRNDNCPCGSGKKYKHCHMRQDNAAMATAGNQPAAAKRKKKPQRRR